MVRNTRFCFRAKGFTLIELLAVIAIIALLISILLPTLNQARKSADKVKCLAALRQIHNAYLMYANENKGWWPVAQDVYVADPTDAASAGGFGVSREKRWHDFLSKYLLGPMQINIGGTSYSTKELNTNGTSYGASPLTSQPTAVVPAGNQFDPANIATIKDRTNVFWGCPSWRRVVSRTSGTLVDAGTDPGYGMMLYPLSPADTAPSINANAARIFSSNAAANGHYFRQSQWKNPPERGLVCDSVGAVVILASAEMTGGWLYVPDTVSPFPNVTAGVVGKKYPDASAFAIDFDRHGKVIQGNKPTDQTLNMLYVDGHAATVSCREAYRATRFK